MVTVNTSALPRRGWHVSAVLVGLLFVLMMSSLLLLTQSLQDSEQFGRRYIPLLTTNLVGLLIMLLLIGYHLVRMLRDYRARRIGSRLAVRLVLVFLAMAVVPVGMVFYFSLQFLQHGVDSWFDRRVDASLKTSLELSEQAINLRTQELYRHSTVLIPSLRGLNDDQIRMALPELRDALDAAELSLLSADGQILAYSIDGKLSETPHPVSQELIQQTQRSGRYAGFDPMGGQLLLIRIMLPLSRPAENDEGRLLQVLYPVPSHLESLAANINDTYAYYKQLAYLRDPLKTSFILTLSLVLLQVLLTAVWVAFYLSNRLVEPVRVLAAGTRSVAEGHYHHKLPLPSHDEFGMLVQSFNDMMARIASARDDVQRSQQQAERERAYLGAVLGGLSSGVLTFDRHFVLRTANAAAASILQVEFERLLSHPLRGMVEHYTWLAGLVELIQTHFHDERREWAEQFVLFGPSGRRVLMCRGTSLPGLRGEAAGYVVVFDDVTAMIQGQRDAAWGEVARRLAHEIKNPLTPIQLSAERLRRKYLGVMDAKEAEVLDRSTHTIIQQVQAMEEMVKAFADYAYTPRLNMQRLDLNGLVRDVVDLYRADDRATAIELRLDQHTGVLEADAGRMRQLLHNLLKNALEAMAEAGLRGPLSVSTRRYDADDGHYIELRVQDSGPGMPEALVGQVFEPYMTSKPKGTGLGLAIVKKIAEEHGGVVWVENVPQGGAMVITRLPLPDGSRVTA